MNEIVKKNKWELFFFFHGSLFILQKGKEKEERENRRERREEEIKRGN